jgi:3-oxoacyl-[acyl-carrier-protein] synthase II
MSKRRVVVTGMGIVSPVGNSLDSAWEPSATAARASARSPTSTPPATRPNIAGEVRDFDPKTWLPHKDAKRMDTFIHYGLRGGDHGDGRRRPEIDESNAERAGVLIGSGIGGVRGIEETAIDAAQGRAAQDLALLRAQHHHQHGLGPAVHPQGLQGPELLRRLRLRLVEPLGRHGDAHDPVRRRRHHGRRRRRARLHADLGRRLLLDEGAVHAQRRAHPRQPPWDRDRDGFVLSDGAGILILEEYESAKKRGARIYCELVGFGASSDAYHMTAPSENGEGPARCMKMAMDDAGLNPDQIEYLNAHGTSTPLGDLAETQAMKRALGDHAYKAMISSTKSMTGHLLGAAGGVEAVFSVLALHHGVIPPTINLETRAKAATSTTCRTSRARRRSKWRCRTASASAAPTAPWCSARSERAGASGGTMAARACARCPPTSTCWRCTGWRRRAGRCCWKASPAATRAGTCSSRRTVRLATRRRWRDADLQGNALEENFLDLLDRGMARERLPQRIGTTAAFHGGWALYLGYELAARSSRCCACRARPARCRWRWRCAARRRSRATATAAAACWCASRARGLVADLDAQLARRARLPPLPEWQPPLAVHEDDPARFLAGVRRVHEYLRAGDTFQVNLSRKWSAEFARAPEAGGAVRAPARRQSRALRRPARARGWALASSSPERLVRCAAGRRDRADRRHAGAAAGRRRRARVGELVAIRRNAPST